MLGWVVLGKTPRSLPGPRGYNSVNYHLIYYGKRGNLWHGECMRSTECLLVIYVFPIKYMYTGVRIKTILTLTLILTFLHVSLLIMIKRFIYSNIMIEPYHCDVM